MDEIRDKRPSPDKLHFVLSRATYLVLTSYAFYLLQYRQFTKEVSSISSEILLIVLSGSVLVIVFVFILFIALQIQKKHLKAKFNKQLNQIKNNNDDNDTNNTNMITLNSISSNTKSLTDNNSHKSKIKHSEFDKEINDETDVIEIKHYMPDTQNEGIITQLSTINQTVKVTSGEV